MTTSSAGVPLQCDWAVSSTDIRQQFPFTCRSSSWRSGDTRDKLSNPDSTDNWCLNDSCSDDVLPNSVEVTQHSDVITASTAQPSTLTVDAVVIIAALHKHCRHVCMSLLLIGRFADKPVHRHVILGLVNSLKMCRNSGIRKSQKTWI